jgi:bifunctional DNA-binding transcriptional regulator/antitoxin component of YhaV-PrlF toxin-antitoxin module
MIHGLIMSHPADMVNCMPTMKITSSGQISLPADVRRRWGVTRVRLVDHGDHVTLEPLPDDVFAATFGMFPAKDGMTSDELRRIDREEEAELEEREYGRLRRVSARRRSAR